jgi:hypothetical protein
MNYIIASFDEVITIKSTTPLSEEFVKHRDL